MKGHALGETIEQFVTNANDETKREVLACASAAGSKKKVKVTKECYDFQVATGTGMTERIECADPTVFSANEDPMRRMCREFEGYVRFESNKLVEINIELRDSSWADALSDATNKFGKPDSVETDTAQNAYGAKWELQNALWSKSGFIVFADEKLNSIQRRVVEVTLTDSVFWDAHHPKKTKNALD